MKIKLENVKRLRLKRGDVLVANLAHGMDAETLRAIGDELQGIFPDNRVIVLEPGASLEVVESGGSA